MFFMSNGGEIIAKFDLEGQVLDSSMKFGDHLRRISGSCEDNLHRF